MEEMEGMQGKSKAKKRRAGGEKDINIMMCGNG